MFAHHQEERVIRQKGTLSSFVEVQFQDTRYGVNAPSTSTSPLLDLIRTAARLVEQILVLLAGLKFLVISFRTDFEMFPRLWAHFRTQGRR